MTIAVQCPNCNFLYILPSLSPTHLKDEIKKRTCEQMICQRCAQNVIPVLSYHPPFHIHENYPRFCHTCGQRENYFLTPFDTAYDLAPLIMVERCHACTQKEKLRAAQPNLLQQLLGSPQQQPSLRAPSPRNPYIAPDGLESAQYPASPSPHSTRKVWSDLMNS